MSLESFNLADSSGALTRRVWYLPGRSPARRIGIFLDAEFYLEYLDAPAVLERLQADGVIPPFACLLVSNQDPESRHRDFVCNETYARFITETVLPLLRERCAVSDGCFIGGLSLSGLQAAFTALCSPGVFTSVLCQSGSFWWKNEWLLGQLENLAPPSPKWWLSVGTKEHGAGMIHPPTGLHQEIDQDVAVRNFSAAIKARGANVRDHLYEGGHESKNWKDELPAALAWLLGDPPPQPWP